MTVPRHSWLVRLSVALYQRLLYGYPGAFRREYGTEMLLLFRDRCRASVRERGAYGLVALWGATLRDFVASVLREHYAREGTMKQKSLLQWCALAACLTLFIFGGWNSLIQLHLIDSGTFWPGQILPFVVPGTCLLVAAGIYTYYGALLGRLGRAELLLCLGSMWIMVLREIVDVSGLIPWPNPTLWSLFNYTEDFTTVGVCLGFGLFSVRAARSRGLGRWRMVPLGITLLCTPFLFAPFGLPWQAMPPQIAFLWISLMMAGFIAGWMLMAYTVWKAPARTMLLPASTD